MKVPQIDVSMERIYRFQCHFDRISEPDHVTGIYPSESKLGIIEDVNIIAQTRDVNKSLDQDLIETNMKTLIPHRGDESGEPFPDTMSKP